MSDAVRKKSQLEWRYDLKICLEGLRKSNKYPSQIFFKVWWAFEPDIPQIECKSSKRQTGTLGTELSIVKMSDNV